ncbi:S-adenosyl-L-methionine dependent methyltransferase [Trametes sanguinea]|nr:S-adenosyl-L-methionine dependent methyltransferase [Trametes sanguinea]
MDPSATIYTNLMLRIYDLLVLNLSNRFAWRCSTPNTLLPFYKKHLGDNAHLEVGVDTGYYPAASVSQLSKTKLVTLLDLNPNTLAMAETRLSAAGYRGAIETVERSIFDPLPESMRGRYDSVALLYVLHCLPGAFPQKADRVFKSIAPALAPGGVVFGSTILGRDVDHNWLSRTLVRVYNRKGMFGNLDDTEANLRKSLDRHFEEYDLSIEGIVAIFTARKPKAVVEKA